MDIEVLQSFIEVCNYKSISRAAEHLFLAQPTVSKRIKMLESEYGVEFLERRGSYVEPTEAGKTLYNDAVKIVERNKRIYEKMRLYRTGKAGKLIIAISPGLQLREILHAITAFSDKYPDTELVVQANHTTNIPELLASGEVQVGISSRGEIGDFPGLVTKTLSESKVQGLLVGKPHPLWGRSYVKWSELAGENVIYFSDNVSEGTMNRSYTAVKHLSDKPASELVVNSITELIMYAATGNYVGMSVTEYNELIAAFPEILQVIPIIEENTDFVHTVVSYDPNIDMAEKFVDCLIESKQHKR